MGKRGKKGLRFARILTGVTVLLCLSAVLPVFAAEDGEGGMLQALLNGESLQSIFSGLFTNAIADFLSGIINSAFTFIDGLLTDMLEQMFHIEVMVNPGQTTVMTNDMLHNVYKFLYAFTCILVAIKFVFRGFQIYILWRNGDADASPRDMLTGVGEAAFSMIAFPYLYEKGVNVVIFLAHGIQSNLGVADIGEGSHSLARSFANSIAGTLTNGFSAILPMAFISVFLLFVFILWIKLLALGFELLILRLGFPLATLGLIDSDRALYKNYMQVFIKVALTAIIQVTLMSLAMRVIGAFQTLNIFAALALMLTALNAPKLLGQFLVPQGSGGGMQKAVTAVSLVRTAATMLAA